MAPTTPVATLTIEAGSFSNSELQRVNFATVLPCPSVLVLVQGKRTSGSGNIKATLSIGLPETNRSGEPMPTGTDVQEPRATAQTRAAPREPPRALAAGTFRIMPGAPREHAERFIELLTGSRRRGGNW